MSILDGFRWLVPATLSAMVTAPPAVQERDASETVSTLEDFILRLRGARTSPWRAASNREAMGVPAVFKAVSLISNTIGTLSMEAQRNGQTLGDFDTPRLIVRPNPLTTPFDFFRDSAYHKARRGETWWWIPKRDSDGFALSLFPIDPREIVVEPNKRNRLRPIIKWLGVEMPNDDMKLMKYLPDPNNPYRGIGPLQACGAAISVAVEAQEWAANWFAGNPGTTWIKSLVDLTDEEALLLKTSWIGDAGNLPKVSGPNVESVQEIGADPDKAQLSDTRLHQNGEVALMFSMPSTLLNFAVQGSTITYQNVGQVFEAFVKECLLPNYLEPMEQVMSDLLSRTSIARFSVAGLERADPKTRAEVDAILIPLGVKSIEQAQQEEGYLPGDVENRPVPFSSPAATPVLPVQLRSVGSEVEVFCANLYRGEPCERRLGTSSGHYSMWCSRCKQMTVGDAPAQERADDDMARALVALASREPVIVPAATDMAPVAAALRDIRALMSQERVPNEPSVTTVNVPPVEVRAIDVNLDMEPFTEVVAAIHSRIAENAALMAAGLQRLEEQMRPRERTIVRDEDGRIVRIVETPVEIAS